MKWSGHHFTLAARVSIGRAAVPHLIALLLTLNVGIPTGARASQAPASGVASWYGEDHRGRLMANGKKFDPDKFTAASWFYPLGTKVRVTAKSRTAPERSVLVTITDRGPADDLVRSGRIIDLSHAPFKQLTSPDRGLIAVTVEVVRHLRRVRS